MSTKALFFVCPLPGCSTGVSDPRQPCPSCAAAFGGHLRPADGPAPDRDEYARVLRERDEGVREILASRHEHPSPPAGVPERKPGQRCWVCDERRSCRRDPDFPQRWLCRRCEAL